MVQLLQRPGGVDDEFNTGALRFNTTLGVLSTTTVLHGFSSGVKTYSTVSSSFSALCGVTYFVNTGGGQVTATLPASPDLGAEITFMDVA